MFLKHGFILEHLQISKIYCQVSTFDPLLIHMIKFLDEYSLNLLIKNSSVLVTAARYYY